MDRKVSCMVLFNTGSGHYGLTGLFRKELEEVKCYMEGAVERDGG